MSQPRVVNLLRRALALAALLSILPFRLARAADQGPLEQALRDLVSDDSAAAEASVAKLAELAIPGRSPPSTR